MDIIIRSGKNATSYQYIHKSRIHFLKIRPCTYCPAQTLIEFRDECMDKQTLITVTNDFGELVRAGGHIIPYGYSLHLTQAE